MDKFFTKDHEWVEVDGEFAFIGISEHAAEELGDITFVELPEMDAEIIVGDPCAVVESVKAASDIYAPVSGKVVEVNATLEENPALINDSAEDEGWLCKITDIDVAELDSLMTVEEYEQYLKEI